MDSRVVFVNMMEYVEQGSTQVPGNVELVTNIYCLQQSSQNSNLTLPSFTLNRHYTKDAL